MPRAKEYTFGPSLGVAVDLPVEQRPIDIDLIKMSDNLTRDFPEITQDGWSNVMVHITEEMSDRLLGYTSVVGQYRRSLYFRCMKEVSETLFPKLRRIKYNKLKAVSNEEDIFVAIRANPDREGNTPYAIYYDNPSKVSAHELKHAAEYLRGSLSEEDVKLLAKESRKNLAILAGASTGILCAISGLFELKYATPRLELSLPSLIGGLALTGFSLSRVNSTSLLDSNPMLNPSLGSEELAHAYAIATESSWADVIRTGTCEQPDNDDFGFEDWAEEEEVRVYPWFK